MDQGRVSGAVVVVALLLLRRPHRGAALPVFASLSGLDVLFVVVVGAAKRARVHSRA